jgi:hypothetical protein
MRWRDLSSYDIADILLNLLKWLIAIASAAGTLALLGWIVKMIVTKDKSNELH